jgi:hypothetical protein
MTILPLQPDSGARPLPPGWCYQCFDNGRLCRGPGRHDRAQPDTLTAVAERLTDRLLVDADLPGCSRWDAGHVALVRAVIADLAMYVDVAEQHLAGR